MLRALVLSMSLFLPASAAAVQESGESSSGASDENRVREGRLGHERFARAFESAFEAVDSAEMTRLVRDNPTSFARLFARKARMCIQGDPSTPFDQDPAFELARALAEAAFEALGATGLVEMIESMEGWTEQDRKSVRMALESAGKGQSLAAADRWSDAIPHLESARSTFMTSRCTILLADTLDLLGTCHEPLGHYAEVIECAKRAAQSWEEIGDPLQTAFILNSLGIVYLNTGDYSAAFEVLGRSLRIRESVGDRNDVAVALGSLASCHSAKGDVNTAIELHERELKIQQELRDDAGTALALHNLGVCQQKLGQFRRALELHERAFKIREKTGSERDRAQSLSGLGSVYYYLGDYREAIKLHESALEIRRRLGIPEEVASTLGKLAHCHTFLGEYERSIELSEVALRIDEEIGNANGCASSLSALGVAHKNSGHLRDAIRFHERALEIRRKLGNENDLAPSLGGLGVCYMVMGDDRKAIEWLEQALEIQLRIGNPQEILTSLTNLCDCHFSRGELAKAFAYLDRAQVICEEVDNPQDKAATLALMARSCLSIGQCEKAVELVERALEVGEQIGNKRDNAESMMTLGKALEKLLRHEEAEAAYERALQLREDIGNQRWIASCLLDLGNNALFRGENEKALTLLERADLILRENQILDPELLGYCLDCLAVCHASLGALDQALPLHERSLACYEEVGYPQNIVRALINLGRTYQQSGRFDESLACFTRSAGVIAGIHRRTLPESWRRTLLEEWSTLPSQISAAAEKASDPANLPDAFMAMEGVTGLTLIERIQERGEGVLQDLDPGAMFDMRCVLASLERSRLILNQKLIEQKPKEEIDRVRNEIRSLEEEADRLDHGFRRGNLRLAELRAPRPASIDRVRETVLQPREVLVRYVLGEEQSYVWVVSRETVRVVALPSRKEIVAAQSRLFATLQRPGSLPHDLEFADPARRLYRMILEPIESDLADRTHLLVVPDGELGFVPFETLLTADLEESPRLEELPFLLRQKTVRYAPTASFLVFLADAQAARILRSEPSVVDASGAHRRKSFLLVGDPIYPDEQPVSRRGEGASGDVRWLDPEAFRRLKNSRLEVLEIARRLVAEDEPEAALQLLNPPRHASIEGRQFDLWMGAEANERRLRQGRLSHRIVHLAVHGFFDPEFPWFSGLLLSDGRAPPAEEAGEVPVESADESLTGFLNQLEIARLELDSELVFLSACETARGQDSRAEGILSTARSFLIAGARSVIAAHTLVYDDAASRLAVEFYDRLLAGRPASAALREAKLGLLTEPHRQNQRRRLHDAGREAKLGLLTEPQAGRGVEPIGAASGDRASPPFAHPSCWAPFVLFGF